MTRIQMRLETSDLDGGETVHGWGGNKDIEIWMQVK